MNNPKRSSRLSYDDIVAASLLTPDYQLPLSVQQLPAESQRELLADPLTPVSARSSVYRAQRDLLQSFNQLPHSCNLCTYCLGLVSLGSEAWELMTETPKPNYFIVPAAVADGTLSDADGEAITALYYSWLDLQCHVGLAKRAQAQTDFVSTCDQSPARS
jgi:hypothetical protein